MGEPLENYENVTSAIRNFVEQKLFGMAPSAITVSTVGIVPMMRRLMEELPKINLALSLHAPTQELRQRIVPVAKSWRIPELMGVIDEYTSPPGTARKQQRTIMISYVLLAGVNDSDEHARQLQELVAGRPVRVNLIPYNSFEGIPHDYQEPSEQR